MHNKLLKLVSALLGVLLTIPLLAAPAKTVADPIDRILIVINDEVVTAREVELRVPVACERCDGTGARPGTSPTTCTGCGGAGEVRRVRQSILGQMVTASTCPSCGGTGEEVGTPCTECRGEGRRNDEKTYLVDVPAGVDDGTTLRLTGRGAAGPRGGPPGDLYVHLRVRPHDRFQRVGPDLLHVMPLPMTQAAIGAELPYTTLDGDEELLIPAGTQTGREFRLRGRGVPLLNGRGRGDLVVRVVVETPTALSATQEELLRRLAEAGSASIAGSRISIALSGASEV